MLPAKNGLPFHQDQDLASVNDRRKINLWPWLLALAIVILLITRVPRESLYLACKKGPWLALGIYALLQALIILGLDAYAIRVALAVFSMKQSLYWIFFMRGTTYIMGILNYALGQGALGLYLQRLGVSAVRAAGILIFLNAVNFGVVLLVAGFGLATGGLGKFGFNGFAYLTLGLVTGLIAYLAVIIFCAEFLQRYQILAPLSETGVYGHFKAGLGRLPHIIFLVITYWGAIRLWGIPVPFTAGVAIAALVLFIGSLPLTPYGLGTSQTALIFLCSPYVLSPNPESKAAVVLAFSLIYYSYGILIQALLGIWCWQKIKNNETLPGK